MTTLPGGFAGIRTVLVLAPHPDDAEFGCGGLLSRLNGAGLRMRVAIFSRCGLSLPEGFGENALVEEFRIASGRLGVKGENCHFFDYPVRRFDEYRQDILEDIVTLSRTLAPDLVIMPALEDIHQDHDVIARQGLRAFKHAKVLCYEVPWNMMETRLNFFIPLERTDLDAKLHAIAAYETQTHRPYSDSAFIEGLARVRGVMCNAPYAEAYTMLRWVA